MALRMHGSETSFGEACERAPFAPLIGLVLSVAEAAKPWVLASKRNDQADATGLASPSESPPRAG